MATEPRKRVLRSRAPTRIDLAGGTLDIWPLYLFLNSPLTVNMGIDLFAEATLEERPASGPGRITLRSEDQKAELSLGWNELAEAKAPPQLELHLKLLRHFGSGRVGGTDIQLSTRARSPAGAGLGGSSTLSIAMIGALASWSRPRGTIPGTGGVVFNAKLRDDGEQFIEIVRDVETTVIQVPAGLQDYYGAMYGGLQALHWGAGSHSREELPAEILRALEDRLLLFYSGQSRNSGINNWALFKSFIDRQGDLDHKADVRGKFAALNDAAQALREALIAQKWDRAGSAISKEWEVRRTLAAGITTAEIDQAYELARAVAPISGKICGAGGGGCFFVYFPDPSAREKVLQAVSGVQGVRHLPFRAVPHGLEVVEEWQG